MSQLLIYCFMSLGFSMQTHFKCGHFRRFFHYSLGARVAAFPHRYWGYAGKMQVVAAVGVICSTGR